MRDRLVKLLDYIREYPEKLCPQFNSKMRCKGCKYEELDDCASDRIADHLLANGVIVPPCDTIWFIVDKGTKYATVMPKSIEDLPISKLRNLEKYGYYKTKEEAEQALKGNVPGVRDVEKGGVE